MITMHEHTDASFTAELKAFVMCRGGLKHYLARAEDLGVTDCDVYAVKKGAFIEVSFKVQGVGNPGYYNLVLGPQGRVVSKKSQYPQV